MSLQYALLGLLNYSPMSGYDLKKIFDNSINFFWAAHTSQIYRELKGLEEKKFVDSKMTPGEKGPDRRTYSITKTGKDSFKKWLADFPEPISPDTRDDFLVRVFFSSIIGIENLEFEMRRKLKEYQKERVRLALVEKHMGSYAEMFNDKDEIHYWKICLSRGRYSADANIAWAEESLQYLAKLKKGKK